MLREWKTEWMKVRRKKMALGNPKCPYGVE